MSSYGLIKVLTGAVPSKLKKKHGIGQANIYICVRKFLAYLLDTKDAGNSQHGFRRWVQDLVSPSSKSVYNLEIAGNMEYLKA